MRVRRPDAVVSHRSAAAALGLGDLLADVHEFYVLHRRQPRRADLRLRVWPNLPPGDRSVVYGLPVCTARRIVGDLLAEREDESALARICQDAIAFGLLSLDELAILATPHTEAYGHDSWSEFAMTLSGADVPRVEE